MSWGRLARALSLRLRDGRRTATASKRPWNTALRPGQGVGLRRPTSGGRQVAHLHLTLEKLQELPEAAEEDRAGYLPRGLICLIADNLKIHDSALVRKWLEEHPRIEHAFIPKGAAWLNLIEGWWRVFRRQAFAGQCFADSYEIDLATRVATRQLNRKATPWVWGRTPRPPRYRRRTFVYHL